MSLASGIRAVAAAVLGDGADATSIDKLVNGSAEKPPAQVTQSQHPVITTRSNAAAGADLIAAVDDMISKASASPAAAAAAGSVVISVSPNDLATPSGRLNAAIDREIERMGVASSKSGALAGADGGLLAAVDSLIAGRHGVE